MSEQAQNTIREFVELTDDYAQEIERQRTLAFSINAMETEQLLSELPFDARNLYCVKTGQKRGERNWNDLYSLVALHEKDQAKLILSLMREDGCCVLWAQTDGEMLDRLRIVDPVGYFVYASTFVIKHLYQTPKVSKQDAAKKRAELFGQKIKAYQAVSAFCNDPSNSEGYNALHVANGHLRNILSYDPSLLNLPFKSISDLVKALRIGTLYSELSKVFRSWLTRENEYISANALYDFINQSKGASQFRTKKRSNKEMRIDEMMEKFREFGIDINENMETTVDKGWFADRMKARESGEDSDDARNWQKNKPAHTPDNPRPNSFFGQFKKG